MKILRALAIVLITAVPGANAATIVYTTPLGPILGGATGTGSATLEYDDFAHTLDIDVSFSGLSGMTTVAHIHCCVAVAGTGNAGVAVTPGTLPGFPVGVSAGMYAAVIDLTNLASYTGGFLGGGTASDGEAALIAALGVGKAYLNIHSSTFGGGEIRGFPVAAVPLPAAAWMLLTALGGLGLFGWRRRGSSLRY